MRFEGWRNSCWITTSLESLLGFRHLETRDNHMDQPGLLEGAPGVALALLASATSAEPTWDRLFLLS